MRAALVKVYDAAVFMALGASLVANYLGGDDLPGHPDLADGLDWTFLTLLFASCWIRPRPPVDQWANITAARSGVSVVVICGVAITSGLAWHGYSSMAIGASVLTILVAVRVYGFATTHAHEIGEARFNTAPDPPAA